MKKKTILFFTAMILFSCGHKLDPNVEDAVIDIRNESCISPDWLIQTDEYINLLKVSTNDDLIYLTNDENPNVRYYAFIGLLERNYPKIQDIYDAHRNDKETVFTSNGACLKNWTPINSLMAGAISSDSFLNLVFSENKYHNKKVK